MMGKTADLTVVQKTIIDTLYKEGKYFIYKMPFISVMEKLNCQQSFHQPSVLSSSYMYYLFNKLCLFNFLWILEFFDE